MLPLYKIRLCLNECSRQESNPVYGRGEIHCHAGKALVKELHTACETCGQPVVNSQGSLVSSVTQPQETARTLSELDADSSSVGPPHDKEPRRAPLLQPCDIVSREPS